VVKIHPLHFSSRDFKSKHNIKDNEWDNIFDTSECEILSLKDKDGMYVIKERRPSFVVGWHSTALCEALNSNVIPILMNDHSSRDNSFEIYHLERRSLLWPSEYETVNNPPMRIQYICLKLGNLYKHITLSSNRKNTLQNLIKIVGLAYGQFVSDKYKILCFWVGTIFKLLLILFMLKRRTLYY